LYQAGRIHGQDAETNVVLSTEVGKYRKPCACIIIVEPLVLLILMLTAVKRLYSTKFGRSLPVASV